MTRFQILKRLNRTHEASLQFSWALDLSRSGCPSNQLREEIDHAYHNQNALDVHGESADADFLIPEDREEVGGVDDFVVPEEEKEESEESESGVGGVDEDSLGGVVGGAGGVDTDSF